MKKMMMVAAVCWLALGFTPTEAKAVTVLTYQVADPGADPYYLGLITPGVPPNEARQVQYLNYLLGMTPGTSTPSTGVTIAGSTQHLTRSGNDCGGVLCSSLSASDDGSSRQEGASLSNTLNLGTGYQFLVGHYGGGRPDGQSHVWFVGGLTGQVTIPLAGSNSAGLSNWTLYNPTSVPEGGMTLILLGGALLGLETLRRRIRA